MNNSYSALIPLISGIIQRMDILVWPDPGGLSETDVRLFLVVDCADDVTRKVTIGTAPDGQTPEVDFDVWGRGRSFSEFPNRLVEWRKNKNSIENYDTKSFNMNYEIFSILDDPFFKIQLGARIEQIFIIRFVGDGDPTGILFEFNTHQYIISAPSTYGNNIHTSIDYFIWPSEIFIAPLV